MDNIEKTYRLQLGKFCLGIEIDNDGDSVKWNYINVEVFAGVKIRPTHYKVYFYLFMHPFGDDELREHVKWIKNAYQCRGNHG